MMDTKNSPQPSNVRKGQFLFLEKPEQERYLTALCKKISNGFFYSEQILSSIVDELAPVINDSLPDSSPDG
jgi:hypothetical protein